MTHTVRQSTIIAPQHTLVVRQIPNGWEVVIEGQNAAFFHIGFCSDSDARRLAYHLAAGHLRGLGVTPLPEFDDLKWY